MKSMTLKILIIFMCMSGVAMAVDPNTPNPLSSVSIDITGLDGAEHWVWWEAEEATGWQMTGTDVAPLGYTYNFEVSGFADNPPDMQDWWAYNFVRYEGAEGGFVEYPIHLPSAMSNPVIAVRYGAIVHELIEDGILDWDVALNARGNSVGVYELLDTRDPDAPDPNVVAADYAWSVGILDGPIAAGDHTMWVSMITGQTNQVSYDGFLLYDGASATDPNLTLPVGDDGDGVCYTYFGNTRWMSPPTSSDPALAPVLSDAVKPVVLFNGRDNYERYDITLNGKPFLNGTVIDEPGYYELVVSVSSVPGMRGAYAGANFRVGVTSVCGDPGHPYLASDLTEDCEVDIEDLRVFAGDWLDCTDPAAPCNHVP